MVTVYGADWCEDTQRALRHLRRLGVSYSYQNVDKDPEALGRAKALNEGRRRTPTIDVDGTTLVEPTTGELTRVLEERHQVRRPQVEQLAVYNVGDLERVLRVGLGLLTVTLAGRMTGAWRWPLAAWGIFETVSGAAGTCPVYRALGVSSLAGPGDRPREAERTAWVAAVPEPIQTQG
jgi:glutaredoxin